MASRKELDDAIAEYQKKLDSHLKEYRTAKMATHLGSFAVASGFAVIGIAAGITAPVPTIALATVAYFAGDFGVPVLTEKWRIEDKLSPSRWSSKFKAKRWAAASASREAFTALAVDERSAQKLVERLPAF